MKINSIAGKWMGRLNYVDNYPDRFKGEEMIFEININIENEIVRGTCIDDVTKELSIEPATIEGLYENNEIHFMKY